MTREEAIEILRKNRPTSDQRPCGVELCDAVDMAIAALRQQEAVTKCRDLFDEEGGVSMERLTDCAQGYCEMYCKKYMLCFEDPEDCIFKDEIKLYDAIKSIEGIVPFDRLLELACADKAGQLVVLPCKVGDTVWLLKKKCKYAGEDNDPWCSCDQYWDNVYHKHMWGCAGKDDEGKQFDCEKRDMEWYAQQIEYSLVLYSPNIVLGKNLFLTREEAEAALAGKGGTHEADPV